MLQHTQAEPPAVDVAGQRPLTQFLITADGAVVAIDTFGDVIVCLHF